MQRNPLALCFGRHWDQIYKLEFCYWAIHPQISYCLDFVQCFVIFKKAVARLGPLPALPLLLLAVSSPCETEALVKNWLRTMTSCGNSSVTSLVSAKQCSDPRSSNPAPAFPVLIHECLAWAPTSNLTACDCLQALGSLRFFPTQAISICGCAALK